MVIFLLTVYIRSQQARWERVVANGSQNGVRRQRLLEPLRAAECLFQARRSSAKRTDTPGRCRGPQARLWSLPALRRDCYLEQSHREGSGLPRVQERLQQHARLELAEVQPGWPGRRPVRRHVAIHAQPDRVADSKWRLAPEHPLDARLDLAGPAVEPCRCSDGDELQTHMAACSIARFLSHCRSEHLVSLSSLPRLGYAIAVQGGSRLDCDQTAPAAQPTDRPGDRCSAGLTSMFAVAAPLRDQPMIQALRFALAFTALGCGFRSAELGVDAAISSASTPNLQAPPRSNAVEVMVEPNSAAFPNEAGDAVRIADATHCVVPRAVFFGDGDGLLARPRLSPISEAGRVVGFRLHDVPSRSVYAVCGIRPGDVWLRVNGAVLDSPEAALAVYPSLRAQQALRVDILREGRPVQIRIQLDE